MRLISVWIVLILGSSCGLSETEDYNSNYKIESYNLIIDSLATFDFELFQIVRDGNDEYLYVLNKHNKTIDIYDIEKGKIRKRVNLVKDVRYSGLSKNYFYVINPDSILLIPAYTLRGTVLIDSNGNVRHRYNPALPVDVEFPNLINHSSNPSRPNYYRNGKLFLAHLTLRNTTFLKYSESKTYTDIVFDMEVDSVYFNEKMTYPSEYVNNSYITLHAVNYRVLTKSNKWVYSWPVLNELLIYDSTYNLINKTNAGSRYFSGLSPVIERFPVEKYLEYYISNTSYSRIIEDHIRNRYYRFVMRGRSGFNYESDLNMSSEDKNEFSIMVFDENFNLIDEYDFLGKTYNIYGAFVGERGLFIPKNNYYNEYVSEDTLKYDIINF
ncbi:hypothetical protein GCM10007049_29610 [Echinicola pacifica]|uniref:DUF4221 domain-containing protein n=1 Tax=Echinicola pacifica TaxID=346377 RepID=A0A918Q5W8_9BACT|nr:DUF4221 family protein [Echinicola pacifica]GGZ34314.1 hypothetical protein GCM10007049_29610 [Echinicola pacifica]